MSEVTDADLYADLADWFPLLTPPEEYADEAAYSLRLLREHVDGPLETLLELGAGGGNLASHLRDQLRLTLTDLSPAMVDVSRRLNPGTEHVVGDMRTLRLDRTFDAVLVHDAICFMTTEADLRAAMDTAFVHLRPGGVALLEPDFVREIFVTGIDDGGEDAPTPSGGTGRRLRYLEWTTDPDPTDTTYQVDYAIMLRAEDGTIEVRHDRRVEGLFARQTWLDLLAGVGFQAFAVDDPWARVIFVAKRPGG